MNNIFKIPSVNLLFDEAKKTLLRFPTVILSALLTAVFAIYLVESKVENEGIKVLLTLTLSIPLFLSLSLYRESKNLVSLKHKLIELAIGILFLSLHYQFFASDDTYNYYLKYFHLSLCLHLLVSFIAFTKNNFETEFWQFNRYLFLRLLVSGLYCVVFYCGLALALLTVDKLFSLDIKVTRYMDLWLISIFVLQTWHFLSGVPKLESLKNDHSYPKSLKVFVQYLLIPMVTLYMIILYAYMAKILLTSTWPKGYLGWLVSIISVLGVFNLLLIEPEKKLSQNSWISKYSKFYYILILPLLGMLFVAIGKRISDYGLTEQRYFLFSLGSLLAGLCFYFIFSKNKKIKVIPISLFIVLLVSYVGPLSAYNLSLQNQKSRALNLLKKNNMFANKKTTPASAEVMAEDQIQLSSIFDYIIQKHGLEKIEDWFPKDVLSKYGRNSDGTYVVAFRYQNSRYLMDYLNLEYADYWSQQHKDYFSVLSDLENKGFELGDYKSALLLNLNLYSEKEFPTFTFKSKTYSIEIKKESANIIILNDQSKEVATISLTKLINKFAFPSQEWKQIPMDYLTLETENPEIKYKLLIRSISGEFNSPKNLTEEQNKEMNSIQINNFNGILLLK